MIEHEQFSESSESHLLPFMFTTGQNDTVDHLFLTFWKIKWYFSDIPVSFNFLVIGIDSFDISILKIIKNRVRLDYFRLYHSGPTVLYHFVPSDLLFTVFVTIQKYDTPQ